MKHKACLSKEVQMYIQQKGIRKKMRKLWIGQLATTMCLAVLVGCVLAGVSYGASRELEVWLPLEPIVASNSARTAAVKEFEREYNVKVNLSWVTQSDLDRRFVTAIEAGTPPDVAGGYERHPARFHALRQLLDVGDVVNAVDKAQGGYFSGFAEGVRFGGKYYAVPWGRDVCVMYYRKDKLAEAGLGIPSTWDEFRDAATKISNPDKGEWGTGMTYNRSNDGQYAVRGIIWSFGGKLVNEDGVSIALDSMETIEAMEYMKSLFDRGAQPPGAIGWGDPSNNEAYMGGKIYSTLNGGSIWWALLEQSHPLKDKTVVAIPPGGSAGRYLCGTAFEMMVFNKTENPELAKDFVRYFVNSENLFSYYSVSGGQEGPVTGGLMEKIIELYKDKPNSLIISEAAKYARFIGWPGPITPTAAEVASRSVLEDMMVRVVADDVPVVAALKEAIERIKDIYMGF